jgi:hypothetical protein
MIPVVEMRRLMLGQLPLPRDGNNRFPGLVNDLEVDGLMGRVELVVTESVRGGHKQRGGGGDEPGARLAGDGGHQVDLPDAPEPR